MLSQRLDVPFLAPQLMAFPVERAPLERLNEAYERAVVDADNRGLVELWEEHLGRYLEERAQTGWRVPRATFLRMAESVRNARHIRTAPAPLRARLDASLERAGAHFGRDMTVRPPAWFHVEDRYLSVLHPTARAIETFRDVNLEEFVTALDGLFVSTTAPPPVGPAGDLRAVRELHFHSETDGREIAPEETNPLRDDCSGPRAEKLRSAPSIPGHSPARERVPVVDAIDHAERAIAFERILEVLVGPYRLSRGSGPFLRCPTASRPFGPLRSQRAPLFRIRYFADFSDGWRWIVGAGLRDAHREVSLAKKPDQRLWSEEEELADWVSETAEEAAAAGEARNGDVRPIDLWYSWREVTKTWTRTRDRFADLLREAAERDLGVVLLRQTQHCDMEGPPAPRTAVWGEPVREA